MRFIVTASKEHQLRSESVISACQGIDVVEELHDAGFTILLVLDSTYQALSVSELQVFAAAERAGPGPATMIVRSDRTDRGGSAHDLRQ